MPVDALARPQAPESRTVQSNKPVTLSSSASVATSTPVHSRRFCASFLTPPARSDPSARESKSSSPGRLMSNLSLAMSLVPVHLYISQNCPLSTSTTDRPRPKLLERRQCPDLLHDPSIECRGCRSDCRCSQRSGISSLSRRVPVHVVEREIREARL